MQPRVWVGNEFMHAAEFNPAAARAESVWRGGVERRRGWERAQIASGVSLVPGLIQFERGVLQRRAYVKGADSVPDSTDNTARAWTTRSRCIAEHGQRHRSRQDAARVPCVQCVQPPDGTSTLQPGGTSRRPEASGLATGSRSAPNVVHLLAIRSSIEPAARPRLPPVAHISLQVRDGTSSPTRSVACLPGSAGRCLSPAHTGSLSFSLLCAVMPAAFPEPEPKATYNKPSPGLRARNSCMADAACSGTPPAHRTHSCICSVASAQCSYGCRRWHRDVRTSVCAAARTSCACTRLPFAARCSRLQPLQPRVAWRARAHRQRYTRADVAVERSALAFA